MKKLIILTTLFALTLSVRAQQPVSLDDYRQAVLDYSNQMKISQANIEAAQHQLKVAKTGFLPSLSATADANYLTNSPMSIPGFSIKNYSYNATLTIQQNIYTGNSATNQTKASKIELEIAQLGQAATIESVLYGADVTYWALAASKSQLEVMQQYVAIVENLYKIVQVRFTDGYVSKTDLLMVETRLNEARLQEISALKGYNQALQALNVMAGSSSGLRLTVSDSINSPVAQPSMLSLEYALENRPEYSIAQRQVDLQNQYARLARAKFNPQLIAGIQGNTGTPSININGNIVSYGVIFASFRANIFHWGERRNTVSAALAAARVKEYSAVQTKDNISLELQNSQTALEQTYEQVLLADKNMDIAQDNLDLNTYSYNEGRLPILDVLSSQLSWIQSFTAAVNANYAYKVAVADYEKATGTIAK